MRAHNQPSETWRYVIVASLAVLGSIFIWAPVLFLLIFSVAASTIKPGRAPAIACAAFFAFLFGWINSNKIPDGDWSWYLYHFQLLQDIPIYDYFGQVHMGVSARLTEPVYHVLAWILSITTSAQPEVLAVVVTAIIYGSVAYFVTGTAAALTATRLSGVYVALAIICASTIGITFTLTTHLVRQELAIAFLLGSLCLEVKMRRRPALALAMLAVLTHNSAIIPAFVLIFIVQVKLIRNSVIRKSLIGAASLALLGFGYYFSTSDEIYRFGDKNDGAIGLLTYVLDAAIVIGASSLLNTRSVGKLVKSFFIPFVAMYSLTVIGASQQPLALLRMYFYFELIRVVGVTLICLWLAANRAFIVLSILAIVGFYYVSLRMDNSPFYFGGEFVDYFFARPI
ncbi:TPA: EpsG family protein [Stenotrophomonas maltophilia]